MNSHLKFHHLGLAVSKPELATDFVLAMGYMIVNTVYDPNQNVNLSMYIHPTEPAIEIIWPGESIGPIHDLTTRHPSGVVYHICYETENLEVALAKMQQTGIKALCISPPKPAPLFGNRPVSFYNVRGFGLIEILSELGSRG